MLLARHQGFSVVAAGRAGVEVRRVGGGDEVAEVGLGVAEVAAPVIDDLQLVPRGPAQAVRA
jgi:hypothetical protein